MKKTKKGSSTVLVILIVITVVLFGVMNMMTVYTSYKISQKNLEWTNKYYELDSKAQLLANNIKSQVEKSSLGSAINKVLLLNELEKNIGKDKQIYINKKLLKIPLDKKQNIVQNNHIKIETFLLDENGKRRFYTNIDIPATRGIKAFDIKSWKRVNEEFEYKSTQFAEGEEVVDVVN